MKVSLSIILCCFLLQICAQSKKQVTKVVNNKTAVSTKNTSEDNFDIRGYYSTKDSRFDDKPMPAHLNPYSIVVSKKNYELKVYDSLGWLATYPIVFGSKDQGDKMFQGDKKTPYGKFKIIFKKYSAKWGPLLMLDYPLQEHRQQFELRKSKGIIPKNKKIGGDIAIHATRKDEEWTVDTYYNWTDGCVSVKFTDMVELFDLIPVGTPVTIED